jgi:hypothetical protein
MNKTSVDIFNASMRPSLAIELERAESKLYSKEVEFQSFIDLCGRCGARETVSALLRCLRLDWCTALVRSIASRLQSEASCAVFLAGVRSIAEAACSCHPASRDAPAAKA